MVDCIMGLCCFNKLIALHIEILTGILIFIGIIIDIFGKNCIPFDSTDNDILKLFFDLNFYFFIFIFIPLILFVILRVKLLVNISTKMNRICLCLSLFQMVTGIFGFIFHFVSSVFIINGLISFEKVIKKKLKENIKVKDQLMTTGQWTKIIFILTSIFIIWVLIMMLLISEIIRIFLKINGPYKDYKKALKEENQYINAINYSDSNASGININKKKLKKQIIKSKKEEKKNNQTKMNEKDKNKNVDNTQDHNPNDIDFTIEDCTKKGIQKQEGKEMIVKIGNLGGKDDNPSET